MQIKIAVKDINCCETDVADRDINCSKTAVADIGLCKQRLQLGI